MLAEYTEDLASLFQEGGDADFLRSTGELIAKLRMYVYNKPLRDAVSAVGYRRVYADGHDVSSRMKQMLSWIQEVRYANHE